MTAPVRIEAQAFADPRVELLGALAGYNRYEALGRLAHLWRFCTERNSYVVSDAVVTATLGDRGVSAILGAELGDRVDDGIRVRGTEGRIEWLEKKRAASAAGGEANRRRLHGGNPSGSQQASHPALSAKPTKPTESHSDSQTDSRTGSQTKPRDSSLAPDLVLVPDPQISDSHTPRAYEAPAGGYDPANSGHVNELLSWTFRSVSAARVTIGAEFAIAHVLPFPMRQNMPNETRGARDLRERIREEGPAAPAVCTQVVAALLDEGRSTKSVDWLSEKAFTPGGWIHAREAVPGNRRGAKKRERKEGELIGSSTPHADYPDDPNPHKWSDFNS